MFAFNCIHIQEDETQDTQINSLEKKVKIKQLVDQSTGD